MRGERVKVWMAQAGRWDRIRRETGEGGSDGVVQAGSKCGRFGVERERKHGVSTLKEGIVCGRIGRSVRRGRQSKRLVSIKC
jgi:hypothetical protein